MDAAVGLAAWAGLLADRTRASFCLALLDGRAWTVGELAKHAGVALSTASEHADRLVAGGMLAQRRQGRHRYLELANPQVAALIETVAAAHPSARNGTGTPVTTLAAAHKRRNLAFARTCYDHLAGYLGVAIADAMVGNGFVTRTHGTALTPRGVAWLGQLGVDLGKPGRRAVLRDCLDWTERRSHLAGVAGSEICRHALAAGWVVRIGSGRAVKVTPVGERALADQLGLVIGAAGTDSPGAAHAMPAGARRR
ncbi:ArsR/SmtB family transcription factor [Paractinoplanes durhamensis]|uniref:Transcriptional regulator n=1 Tax=Paractinoplanes durhamensis TaxID=113563 RepID=A0ABQ3YQK7_9ACTN|nr:winged helix-turn-helix domain-containing protein [Actinoplanes durhamensis]GID99869.1 transcriptional regulator [Actinoplanes durhamensis]